jgi:metal-dependent amidase/aminoacylase/carboxypeptidase family protein
MNAGAALGLKRAITEIGGRVIVFGCPNGSKLNMLNNGEFDDIDAVICGHAATKTYESGTSLGCTYVDFTFRNKKSPSKIEAQSMVTPQNPAIQLFSLIETFKANYPGKVLINGTLENKIGCDDIVPGETKCSFSIKAFDKTFIDFARNKLVESAKFCARFYDCSLRYNNSHKSYLPLKTHNELSKIASHNLQERGIINIHGPVTLSEGFELGNISAGIPTINPGIGICKKDSTFTVSEFNKTARSPHAKENMLRAACALALTGVDAIQNPELLKW